MARVEECVACGGSGTMDFDDCVACGGRGYRDVEEEDTPARRRRAWSQAAIRERFERWVEIHGHPPTHSDWNPTRWRKAARASRARLRRQLERAAHYETEEWPSTWAVSHHFGSWAAMFRAMGYESRPVGRPRRDAPAAPPRLDDREVSDRRLRQMGYGADRPGPDELATRVRHVARARAGGDPVALRASLYQLAATAVAWIDLLDSEREDDAA